MGVACLAELVLSLAHRHRLPAAFIAIIHFQSEAYSLTACWPRTETFLLRRSAHVWWKLVNVQSLDWFLLLLFHYCSM